MKEVKIIWLWRAILCLAAITFLAWLFYQNLVPTGILVLQNKKGDPASLISDLHPANRIIETQDNNQTFYVDPVYFDAKVPRAFDKVMVDIAWQNQAQPILELGARQVRGEFGFVLRALQNKIIDDIATPPPSPSSERRGFPDWSCERTGETLFCQKNKKYDNLESYLTNPVGKLLVYRYKPEAVIKYDAMSIETKLDGYDYLITTYAAPESLGDDWYQRRVEYDWKDFALHINKISFILSAPRLNQGHGDITVGDIRVTLEREPLDWEGFKEYVKNQGRRFK